MVDYTDDFPTGGDGNAARVCPRLQAQKMMNIGGSSNASIEDRALTCCSFSPDKRFLCVGHASGRLTLCSVEDAYNPTRTIINSSGASMKCCCYVGDSFVAAGFFPSGRVSIAHVETTEDFASATATTSHGGGIRCCDFFGFSSDIPVAGAGHLAVGDSANCLKVYQIEHAQDRQQLSKVIFQHQGFGTVVCCLYAETRWHTFLAAGKGTGEVALYQLTEEHTYTPLLVYAAHGAAAVMACFYSHVLDQLVLGDRSGGMKLLSLRGPSTKAKDADGPFAAQDSTLKGDVTCSAYSPKNHALFCVGTDQGSLWSWTYSEGKYVQQHGACIQREEGGQPVKCIAFSPDGSELVVVESALFTTNHAGKVDIYQVIDRDAATESKISLALSVTFLLPKAADDTSFSSPCVCEYIPRDGQEKLLYVAFKTNCLLRAKKADFYSISEGKTMPTPVETVLHHQLNGSSQHLTGSSQVSPPYFAAFSPDGEYAALARIERSSSSAITNILACKYTISGRTPHFQAQASILYDHVVSCMAFSLGGPNGSHRHLAVCTEGADFFSIYDMHKMPSPNAAWPLWGTKEHPGGVRCLSYTICKSRQYVAVGGKSFQLCVVGSSGYHTVSLSSGDLDCYCRQIAFSLRFRTMVRAMLWQENAEKQMRTI